MDGDQQPIIKQAEVDKTISEPINVSPNLENVENAAEGGLNSKEASQLKNPIIESSHEFSKNNTVDQQMSK